MSFRLQLEDISNALYVLEVDIENMKISKIEDSLYGIRQRLDELLQGDEEEDR